MKTSAKKIAFQEVLKLVIQRVICLCAFTLLYPLLWCWVFGLQKYRIPKIQSIRKEFSTFSQASRAPVLICANHLTYLDSVLLVVALGSFSYYIRHFYALPWNFPKITHLTARIWFRIICYLGKCVAIYLDVSKERANELVWKSGYLISKGEYLMIFPEGTRSRSGFVDTQNFAYGVGNLIQAHPELRILCIYLRGRAQQVSSDFPIKGDAFYCVLKPLSPSTHFHGLRATRDLATQIMHTLSDMETTYLAQQT